MTTFSAFATSQVRLFSPYRVGVILTISTICEQPETIKNEPYEVIIKQSGSHPPSEHRPSSYAPTPGRSHHASTHNLPTQSSRVSTSRGSDTAAFRGSGTNDYFAAPAPHQHTQRRRLNYSMSFEDEILGFVR